MENEKEQLVRLTAADIDDMYEAASEFGWQHNLDQLSYIKLSNGEVVKWSSILMCLHLYGNFLKHAKKRLEEQRKEVGAEAAHNRSVNERDNIRNALLEELREKIRVRFKDGGHPVLTESDLV